MNIRDWPLDRIMQLPDHCFGRRWPIGLYATLPNADPVFDIAEFALPESTMIWEIWAINRFAAGSTAEVCLALGDHLPATAAEFDAFDLVFPGLVSSSGRRGAIDTPSLSDVIRLTLRTVLSTSGRRFVGRFIRAVGTTPAVSCGIVVSSVPTEVPDCLLSV